MIRRLSYIDLVVYMYSEQPFIRLDRDATVGTELGGETSNLARSELVHASG